MPDFTAIYLRVSTEEQAKEGVSLDMQRDRCEKYVELHSLPVDTIVYSDDGKSGSTLDRPALDRLRSDLTGGIIKHVVVLKLDRMSRRLVDMLAMIDEIEAVGAAIHSVDERLDTSSAVGRLILQILGSFAEFERNTIADRTRAGLAHIQGQGYHVGGAPFGWELASHDGPGSLLVPSGDYPLIADARKAQREGMSLAGIGSIIRGKRHPQVGKRIVSAPLIEEMVAVKDSAGMTMGYRHPVE